MRRLLLSCLALALLLPQVADAEEAVPEHRWSIGWSSGLELHRRLGTDWDAFLGAGPDDSRSDEQSWTVQEEIGEDGFSDTAGPVENTIESGRVWAGLGRRLFEQEALRVELYVSGYYRWSHGKNEYVYLRSYDGSTRLNRDLADSENYSVSLGLRPTFRIHERVTVETRFALAWAWFWSRSVAEDWERDGDGVLERYSRDTRERSGDSFEDVGVNDLYSVRFAFWF